MAAVPESGIVGAAGIAPVVVIGTGPAGVRFVQELHRAHPGLNMVVYGNEPWPPYDRTKLSSFLAGDTGLADLGRGCELPKSPLIDVRLNCEVIAIDRIGQSVLDSEGRTQAYSRVVLATGSRPRIPDVPGIGQANVHVFRGMSDAQRLFARRMRSRRTVVLGGGLLGLEVARAMRRFNTDVWVVEHNRRLMMDQLDEEAAERLRRHVEECGIRVLLGERVKCIHGEGSVTGVGLRGGQLDCDTVVVAAGVQPDTLLARQSGIAVRRGIRVTAQMRTSDPDIYAIGECAEFGGTLYGLAAPGLEQAAVAARSVLGVESAYDGSLPASTLNLPDLPVVSIGRVSERDLSDLAVAHSYSNGDVYRKLFIERGRLIGVIAVGAFEDLRRWRETIAHRRLVYPWQLRRFRRTGSLWPAGKQAWHSFFTEPLRQWRSKA